MFLHYSPCINFKSILTTRTCHLPLQYHYFCPKCSLMCNTSGITVCPNSACGQVFDKPSYFITIPIEQQLQTMFQRHGFYSDLQHRFHRNNHSTSDEDTYDGLLYRSHMKSNGFLTSPHDVSFMLNTDGIAVFKSSNVSLWPIYLQINELPYQKRKLKENVILCGLWLPCSISIATELKHMYENGIEIISPDVSEVVRCKAILFKLVL